MVIPGETSLRRLRAVWPIKFAARFRASASRRSSLLVLGVVVGVFTVCPVSGLRVTGVRLTSGFFGLCSLFVSSEFGSGLVGLTSSTGFRGGYGSRTLGGSGGGAGCATGGAGGVSGAGGSGVAWGLPPPESAASISFPGMTSRIGELSDLLFDERNAGPTSKITASSR